ncbi:MAG: hypothetical protein P8Q42_11235 [Flavobacteriales bacterium]|nr:hypothetical protein [Flavobacteriales bacterium]
MLVYKNNKSISLLLIIIVLFACSKDEKEYVYQIDEVEISQAGAEKPNVKTSTEYISIAYADVFGSNVPTNLLEDLKKIYESFGDKGVAEDLIIKNFLNDNSVQIPTNQEMEENISLFVTNAYKKVFNRAPNEAELWFLKDCIEKDSNISPEVVYYALMTSNEYRQF